MNAPPPRTFHNVNVFFRTVVLLALVLLVGWWTLMLKSKLAANERTLAQRTEELDHARSDLEQRKLEVSKLGKQVEERGAEIVRLQDVITEQDRLIKALELAKRLLAVSHRVARIEVLAQGSAPQGESVEGVPIQGSAPVPGSTPEGGTERPESIRTTVRFTELGADGEPLAVGRELTIEGKTIYVESLVIQFEDRYVEQGDALRGTSLCLFRRLFGENQSPSEGVALDSEEQLPLVYRGDMTIDPVHRALWERFWDYANDPALAKQVGVRALQGEAPFIEARVGKTYRLELRASGGLVFQAE